MKKIHNFLAFDLGASNGRAILGQFDGEKITMTELHRFENNYVEMNGAFYWDLPYLYSQLIAGLQAFQRGNYGELDAFGIDTWGVDYGFLDKNGHLLGLPRSYRMSTQTDVDAVQEKISPQELYRRSGIHTEQTYNTLYQLYRRKQEDDVALKTADTMLLMPDLLGYFLSGAKKTERTIATTTQLYDLDTGDWDWKTIEELGLPKHIFTPIQPSGTVRGYLRPELCEDLGINPAAHVAVGSHDTASSVAAIPGQGSFAFCSSGTWSLFGVELDKPTRTEEAFSAGLSNEGTIQGGFRPLRNIVGLWIIQECRRDWNKQGKSLSWDEIVAQARQVQPLRSIIDTDAPEFYAGGNMEKKIQDFCRRTGQPVPQSVGEIARCVYESLALKYRYVLSDVEKMKGQRITSLNIVGGGCKNRLLDQMVADALDLEVVTGPVEGAALGNLLTQAMALGYIRDLEELRQVVRRSEAVEVWQPHHTPEWEAAYEKLLTLLH